MVQGALLGAQQNASVLLTDFPMAMLQPMFRAVPALQHMAPAVGSGGPSPPGAAFLNNLTLPFLKCAPTVSPGRSATISSCRPWRAIARPVVSQRGSSCRFSNTS